MGMFDYYRPKGVSQCPTCHKELRGWQGKDGPCMLLVWKQGISIPIGFDEECGPLPEGLPGSRLPPEFNIYSDDCGRHSVSAACKAVDGVWRETRVTTVSEGGISAQTAGNRSHYGDSYQQALVRDFGKEWAGICNLSLEDRLAAIDRIQSLQGDSPRDDAWPTEYGNEPTPTPGWDPSGSFRSDVVKQVYDEYVAAGKIPRLEID